MLAGPIRVSRMPTDIEAPSEELSERIRAELRRERIGALLLGRPGGEPDFAQLTRRWCAGPEGLSPRTACSLLVAEGVSDSGVLRALWWVGPPSWPILVRHLLRVEAWSGPRVIQALAAIGIPADERSRLLDPTAR